MLELITTSLLVPLGCLLAWLAIWSIDRKFENTTAVRFVKLKYKLLGIVYKLDRDLAAAYKDAVGECQILAMNPRLQEAARDAMKRYEAYERDAVSRAEERLRDLEERAATRGVSKLLDQFVASLLPNCHVLQLIFAVRAQRLSS